MATASETASASPAAQLARRLALPAEALAPPLDKLKDTVRGPLPGPVDDRTVRAAPSLVRGATRTRGPPVWVHPP